MKTLLALLLATTAAHAADDIVARGEYLTHAADCAACHTAPGGRPFAGGRAFDTPVGRIYSPNITPDRGTGVADYTDDEWVSMLQRGVGHDGKHLYPVMPYTSYTEMTRDDALAIKAFLFTLTPVSATPPENTLPFPFNMRWLMVVWNFFFSPDQRFQPNPAHDAVWNRGAYLAEALGHCQQCHTPRNLALALKASEAYAGADQQGWRAYNITAATQGGIGAWSQQDLETYLSTGHADGHGIASGPMGEAVGYSLRYLKPEDVHALATYVKSIPAIDGASPPQRAQDIADDPTGARVYREACAACHRADGGGTNVSLTGLAGARTAADPSGVNLVQVLLEGGQMETKDGPLTMPSFARGYTDAELAAVANQTIARFGGVQGHVTAEQVGRARAPGQRIDEGGAKPGV